MLLPLNFASMRTPVYVELHQTGEKLAWGQTGPLGGSRLPQLSLFLSPSVAIYFSWQKNNFGTKDVKLLFFFFFCSPADAVHGNKKRNKSK